MAEYIEREAAIELLRSLGSRDYRREKGTIAEAMKMISHPEYTPAADVTPVVHGRNITGQHPVDEFICSECGLITRDNNRYVIDEDSGDESCYEFTIRYCPLCGAKIDGGEDDETD